MKNNERINPKLREIKSHKNGKNKINKENNKQIRDQQ